MTIDELAVKCEEEIGRILSTMQVQTLSGYWSQGKISSIDLFDYYNDYLVTIDTSSLAPVSIQNTGIIYYRMVDNDAIEYEIKFTTYMDDTVEKHLPDGTLYYERATEYTTYRYFPIEADDELYLCIEGGETGDAFESEAEKAYSLVTIK